MAERPGGGGDVNGEGVMGGPAGGVGEGLGGRGGGDGILT